jgi:hypothetical protein
MLAMVVHDQAVWILMSACSLGAVAYSLMANLRAASPEPRRHRVGRCISAMLDGVGLGLAITFLFLSAAAVLAHL